MSSPSREAFKVPLWASRVLRHGTPLTSLTACSLQIPESCRPNMEEGISLFSSLLNNKHFLIVFVHALEQQKDFAVRDRSGCRAGSREGQRILGPPGWIQAWGSLQSIVSLGQPASPLRPWPPSPFCPFLVLPAQDRARGHGGYCAR